MDKTIHLAIGIMESENHMMREGTHGEDSSFG